MATAHVLALEKEAAGGKRFSVVNEPYKWQDWGTFQAHACYLYGTDTTVFTVNAAHAIDPKIPAGNTAYNPATAQHVTLYDTTNTDSILGLKYHSMEESTKAILENFKSKGWL